MSWDCNAQLLLCLHKKAGEQLGGQKRGEEREEAGPLSQEKQAATLPGHPRHFPYPIHLKDLTLSLLLHILLGQEVLQATPEKGGSAWSG